MDDACETLDVDCQLVFNQENGNLQMQLTNLEALVEQGIDGISLVIVEDNMFDEAVQKAVDAGIPVITTNVDDSEGAAGNARLAFVGQDLFQAGYELGKELSKQFPDGDTHVLLGLSAPGQSWAEARIGGVESLWKNIKLLILEKKLHGIQLIPVLILVSPVKEFVLMCKDIQRQLHILMRDSGELELETA